MSRRNQNLPRIEVMDDDDVDVSQWYVQDEENAAHSQIVIAPMNKNINRQKQINVWQILMYIAALILVLYGIKGLIDFGSVAITKYAEINIKRESALAQQRQDCCEFYKTGTFPKNSQKDEKKAGKDCMAIIGGKKLCDNADIFLIHNVWYQLTIELWDHYFAFTKTSIMDQVVNTVGWFIFSSLSMIPTMALKRTLGF
jgi:hypothetical protein